MRKLVCNDADYNASTGECAAPQWVPDTEILPEISVGDALALAGAVAGLWAVAWVWRQIGK